MPPLGAIVVRFEVGGLLAIFVGDLLGIVGAEFEKAIFVAVAPRLAVTAIGEPPAMAFEKPGIDLNKKLFVGAAAIDLRDGESTDRILRVAPGDGKYLKLRMSEPLAILAEHAGVVLPIGDVANKIKGFLWRSSWQTSRALRKLSQRKSGAELLLRAQPRLTVM